jgi:hypothetical protein
MTTVCRMAAAFAASAVLCMALAPGAVADNAAPEPSSSASSRTTSAPVSIPAGLYGTKDPTGDGVWRQSLALLGQYAAALRPANQAVAWLKGQQCANGAFPVFRADPGTPCDSGTRLDSRATAAAVQALSTIVGQRPVLDGAMNWLRSVQNEDGGWSRFPGAPSDARSTSLVIGALTSAGVRPSSMRSFEDNSPYDALVALSIPCDAGLGAGAFASRPDAAGKLVAQAAATAAGVLGGIGKRMVVAPVKPGPAPSCRATAEPTPERTARNGAAYLVAALAGTGHLDRPQPPGATTPPVPDPGVTADAVAALAVSGYANQTTAALDWLEKNSGAWAEENGPAAYARLIFAAHTTGTDPRNFGGIDLVQRLNSGGPAPTPVVSTGPQTAEMSQDTDGGGFGVLWIVGSGLVACLVIGYLISIRRSVRQL